MTLFVLEKYGSEDYNLCIIDGIIFDKLTKNAVEKFSIRWNNFYCLFGYIDYQWSQKKF